MFYITICSTKYHKTHGITIVQRIVIWIHGLASPAGLAKTAGVYSDSQKDPALRGSDLSYASVMPVGKSHLRACCRRLM